MYFGLSIRALIKIFWLFLFWQLFWLLLVKFMHFYPNPLVTLLLGYLKIEGRYGKAYETIFTFSTYGWAQ
jgi:hypothetical protein